MRRVRRQVYEWLEPGEQSSTWEHFIDVIIMALILISVVVVVLQSMPELNEYDGILTEIERWCVYFFTVEYLLRIWTCVEDPAFSGPWKGRIRYMGSAFGIIDLLALAPFYLAPLAASNTVVFRLLRIFRLVRVLKFGRYNASVSLLVRVFRSRREELLLSLVLVVTLVVISSTVMYAVEHDAQPKAFASIPAAMWWGVVTLTTVGYGDVFPITLAGRVVAGVSVLLGVGLFALPAGILASGFTEEMRRHGTTTRKVKRACFCLHFGPGLWEHVRPKPHEVWPVIAAALREEGWESHSVFVREDGVVIGFLDTSAAEQAPDSEALRKLRRRWQQSLRETLPPGAAPAELSVCWLEEVSHSD